MALWGEMGKPITWGFNQADAAIGSRLDMVFDLITYDDRDGSALVFTWPGRVKARIFSGLDGLPEDAVSISVYGIQLVDNVGIPGFVIDKHSVVLDHPNLLYTDLLNVFEFCAGMGVCTQGLQEAGMKTVVANELRAPMAELYQAMHPSVSVVVGDINDPFTVIEVHQKHRRSATVMAGFSCQPYSSGGKQMGRLDERSDTLLGVMRAAVMLRTPLILLECVRDAGTNRFVRRVLESFRDEFQFTLNEGILKLEDCWVAKRERWWAILAAPPLGQIRVPPLPCLPFPSRLRNVLPAPFPCSDEELAELLLDENEMKKLLAVAPSYAHLLLNLNKKAPTSLHSLGSQFRSCPCGCRLPFSMETLRERGVYGILVPTDGQVEIEGAIHPILRHPHPNEVAWANGVLVPVQWPAPLRLVLCGLGQMACPIQSLWVASQVVHHLAALHTGASNTSGSQNLDRFMKKLFQQIQTMNGTLGSGGNGGSSGSASAGLFEPSCLVADEVMVPMEQVEADPWCSFRHDGGGDSVTIVDSISLTKVLIPIANRSTTLRELLLAEVDLAPGSPFQVVRDCRLSKFVGPTDEIAGRCLWIEQVGQLAEVLPMDFAEPMDFASSDVAGCPPTAPWTQVPVEHGDMKEGKNVAEIGNELDPQLASMEPLASLNAGQLRAVLLPHIDHLRTVQALQAMTMPSVIRLQVLQHQEGTWSDDEMTWHLNRFLSESKKQNWCLMPILLACDCVRRNGVQLIAQWLETLPSVPDAIVTAVSVGGHWVPFLWKWTSETLTAYSWDAANNNPRGLNVLHDAVCKAVGARTFITHVDIRAFSNEDHCGLCACRWLDSKIRGKMLPTTTDEVVYLHEVARKQYGEMLVQTSSVPRPWIWAAGLEPFSQSRLHDLLAQHGVPTAQIETRAKLLVNALGAVDLQNALTSANPWRLLKSLANRVQPPLQIVLQEELAKVVQSKAGKGEVKGRHRQGKGQGKGKPTAPPPLDPTKLNVEGGSFVTASEQPLSQIDVVSLGPLAEGVALATFATVEPHLKAGVQLSPNALGVLVLNADSEQFQTKLPWSEVRVVLRCKANFEPMLVTALLVQLGQVCVVPSKPKDAFVVPEVEAACIKVSVYKDGIEGSWNDFVQSPIRYILSVLTSLVACHECDDPSDLCGKWHPTSNAVVADPVLDIWRRQWLSSTFKNTEPSAASIFLLNLRYLKSLEELVLRCSGQKGVFVEPKTLDGKAGILDFQVLWMPREPLQELQRLQQCHVLIHGLARMGSRLGVRVRTRDAQELSKVVKPSSVYLSSGVRLEFEVGPLPFGMDRLSVTKLCESWKWQARPMHPVRSLTNAMGTVWHIQSCHDPPALVMKYQGGDIVINKVVKKDSTARPQDQIVGAAATRALCTFDNGSDGRGVDPWLRDDPWLSATKSSPVGGPGSQPPPIVGPNLQQLEARIEQNIMSKLQPGDGDVDMDRKPCPFDVEVRMHELEMQITTLHDRHQQLEVKLDESVQRSDVQINQLQLQVSAQFEAQRGEMQGLFTSQMSQIEALLNKKARHE